MSRSAAVDRLRRPEYTGANRCLPCTVVNALIALVAAVALGALWVPLGVVALVVSAAAICLRGYLVPGTPQLTERYLPERVLAWFERHKGTEPGRTPPDVDEDADVGEVLRELGVLEECRNGTDFCLEESFRTSWRAEIDRLGGADTERDDLADLLEVDPDALTFEEHEGESESGSGSGSGFVARTDDRIVGQWESGAAFLADLGAAHVLDRQVPSWQGFGVTRKGALLNGLRLFLESCPECGGPVALGEETVRSCCRSHDVVAATCEDCGARLFESYAAGGT